MTEVKEEVEALLTRVDELEEAKEAVEQAIDAIENAMSELPHDIYAPHYGSDEWESVLDEIQKELDNIQSAIGGLV